MAEKSYSDSIRDKLAEIGDKVSNLARYDTTDPTFKDKADKSFSDIEDSLQDKRFKFDSKMSEYLQSAKTKADEGNESFKQSMDEWSQWLKSDGGKTTTFSGGDSSSDQPGLLERASAATSSAVESAKNMVGLGSDSSSK